MKKNTFVKLLVLLGLVSLAGCNDNTKQADVAPVSGSTSSAGTTSGVKSADLKVYDASAPYDTPAGTDTVDIKISLDKDKVVQELSMAGVNANPVSERYIALFADGVKTQIIGKKLLDVADFGQVNGASLTSVGFNKALAKIKSDAK